LLAQIDKFDRLQELPASIEALTALCKLVIIDFSNIRALLPSVGSLTALTRLILGGCALTNVPSSIVSLTALRIVSLSIPKEAQEDSRVSKTLACAPPALRLLKHMRLRGLGVDDVEATGCSLKAWPLPLLNDISGWLSTSEQPINSKSC